MPTPNILAAMQVVSGLIAAVQAAMEQERDLTPDELAQIAAGNTDAHRSLQAALEHAAARQRSQSS